jgi:hypothetical protein
MPIQKVDGKQVLYCLNGCRHEGLPTASTMRHGEEGSQLTGYGPTPDSIGHYSRFKIDIAPYVCLLCGYMEIYYPHKMPTKWGECPEEIPS